jgi:hypothetical protein
VREKGCNEGERAVRPFFFDITRSNNNFNTPKNGLVFWFTGDHNSFWLMTKKRCQVATGRSNGARDPDSGAAGDVAVSESTKPMGEIKNGPDYQ